MSHTLSLTLPVAASVASKTDTSSRPSLWRKSRSEEAAVVDGAASAGVATEARSIARDSITLDGMDSPLSSDAAFSTPATDAEDAASAVQPGASVEESAEPEVVEVAGELAPRPIDPAKAEFLKVLQRAKEGDKKAFEEIFQMYHRRIYNAVYGMLSDADDAQDVTQDVFMRLHDALPTLRADEAFSTYLYRIALNLCRDRARRKKRVRFQSIDTPRVDDEGGSETMEFPDAGKLPEETMTNDELQTRVRQAVSTLSEDHKSVIVMHHFQGMEVNDIAAILQVPTGTVKSRLARGRDQLHRKLRTYLGL